MRGGCSKLYVFDVARAGLHQHLASGAADTDPCPLEGLSAFGGGREDCKIKQGRYFNTPLANRCELGFWRTGSSAARPTSGQRGRGGGSHSKLYVFDVARASKSDAFDVACADWPAPGLVDSMLG